MDKGNSRCTDSNPMLTFQESGALEAENHCVRTSGQIKKKREKDERE